MSHVPHEMYSAQGALLHWMRYSTAVLHTAALICAMTPTPVVRCEVRSLLSFPFSPLKSFARQRFRRTAPTTRKFVHANVDRASDLSSLLCNTVRFIKYQAVKQHLGRTFSPFGSFSHPFSIPLFRLYLLSSHQQPTRVATPSTRTNATFPTKYKQASSTISNRAAVPPKRQLTVLFRSC